MNAPSTDSDPPAFTELDRMIALDAGHKELSLYALCPDLPPDETADIARISGLVEKEVRATIVRKMRAAYYETRRSHASGRERPWMKRDTWKAG